MLTPEHDDRWCPALRSDVQQLPEGGAPASLWDPLSRREVALGEISGCLVPLLDGQHPLPALLQAVAARTGAPPARVAASLRSLLLINLIEGSGTATLAALSRVRKGDVSLEPVALPEARFACQGSGDCCRSYTYGPIDEADVARLAALDIAGAFPDLAGAYLDDRQTANGQTLRFLRAIDDRCVFLQPDHRCGVHAHFGEAAKPGMCRDFPLMALPTVGGLRLYDRAECSNFSISNRSGAPITEDRERITRLLRPGFDFNEELEHVVVLLGAEVPCDFGHFLRLQDAMVALCGAGIGRASETLVAVGRMARDFVEGLVACPLRPGEPDRTVDAVVSRAPADYYAARPGEADVAAGWRCLSQIATQLLRMVGPKIAMADVVHTPLLTARTARGLAGVLHLIQVLCAHRAGLIPDLTTLPYHGQVLDVQAGDEDVEAVQRLSLRHQLFGQRALIERRPVAALGRLAFAYLVTQIGARSHAVNEGSGRVRAADFDFGHVLAMRALRNLEAAALFVEHEASAYDLLAAAAALCS